MPKNEYRLMGVPWKTCANSYNINDLLKLDKAPTYEIENWDNPKTELLANAPQLQVRKGSAYDTYFWVKNGWTDDGSDEGAFVEGWCNSDGIHARPGEDISPDGTLTPGVGAWFYNPHDDGVTTPMMSGAVETDDYVLDCPIDFSIRALTVPRAVNVNDSTLLQFTGVYTDYEIQNWDNPKTELLANAPQLQVQKLGGSAYDTYFYVKNGFFDDGSDEGSFVEGWCNSDGMYADPTAPDIDPEHCGTIPAGSAMWTKGVQSAFKIKFIGLK